LKDNANFAHVSVNRINVIDRIELLKEAKLKYNAYDSEDWTKAYFDEISCGFNVYHKEHNFSKKGGGGDAEKIVGKMLAKYHGKQVEFLPENSYRKSPDINFDAQTWDIKLINNAREETIRKAIRDARKADNAIFYWDSSVEKLADLRNAIIREAGRMRKTGRVNEMPDIYYMNKSGLLRTAWKK
jgi:hypothetical protein